MLLFIQRKRNRWNVTGQAGVTNSVQREICRIEGLLGRGGLFFCLMGKEGAEEYEGKKGF